MPVKKKHDIKNLSHAGLLVDKNLSIVLDFNQPAKILFGEKLKRKMDVSSIFDQENVRIIKGDIERKNSFSGILPCQLNKKELLFYFQEFEEDLLLNCWGLESGDNYQKKSGNTEFSFKTDAGPDFRIKQISGNDFLPPDEKIEVNALLSAYLDKQSFQVKKELIREAITNGGKYGLRVLFKSRNGKENWFWEEGRIIFNEKGNPAEIESTLIEINNVVAYENALKENTQHYRNLIDNSPDIVIIHINGVIKYMNPAGNKFFGFPQYKGFQNLKMTDIIPVQYHDLYQKRLEQLEKNGAVGMEEIRIINERNKELEITIRSVKTTFLGEDAVQEIFSNVTFQKQLMNEKIRAELAEEINNVLKLEIQDHKKTQKELQEAKNFTQSIIDSSLDVIYTMGENYKITEFNKAASSLFGYTRNEIIGKSISVLFKNEKTFKNVVKDLEQVGSFTGEILNRKKNGKSFFAYLSASLIKNQEGEVIGSMGVSRDITDLKEAQEKLRKSEERYRDLFENANDYIHSTDKNGNFLYVNRSWKKALQYAESDLKNINIYDIIAPEEQNHYRTFVEKMVLEKKEKSVIETTYITKKGKRIFVEENINFQYKKNEPVAVRSIIRDVTAAKKAEQKAMEQAAKIKAIFNSGSLLFWTVNKNLALTSFNKKYSETIFHLYNVYPEINVNLNKPRKKFAPEYYHKEWEERYKLAFEGKSVNFQTKTIDKFGNVKYREIFLSPITNLQEKDEINEIAGIGIDITDKKKAEEKIHEQASQINSIFESSSHLIWSLDENLKLTSFNENYAKMFKSQFGIKLSTGMDLGKGMLERVKDDQYAIWFDNYQKTLSGNNIQFETRQISSEGKENWLDVFLNPIYNSENKVSGLSGIGNFITFKKQAERKIKDQAAKINSIFNSTAMLIFTLDRNYRITSFNTNFFTSFKSYFNREISIGDNFIEMYTAHLEGKEKDQVKKYYQNAYEGRPQQFENQILTRKKEVKWMESYLNPIFLDDGEIKEISCLAHEITEKKIIDEQIRESLKEKEILLQEVHHRVKNNLQVISSILNLQSSYVKDQNTLDILKESQNRIKTMSFIHETLYQTKDFSSIDFSDYLFSLSKNLIHSYSFHNPGVRLETNFKKVYLNLDQAIPCGLIVNELVSNSLKYAFSGNKGGIIYLSCKEEGNKVFIEIGDNGIGLPEDFDLENSDSLGLQLVFTLVEQLDAKLECITKKGTKYLINFVKL